MTGAYSGTACGHHRCRCEAGRALDRLLQLEARRRENVGASRPQGPLNYSESHVIHAELSLQVGSALVLPRWF
jgi:hypothetical protein